MNVPEVSVLFLLIVSQSYLGSSQPLPLDMANKSVDDTFKGCKKEMYDLVMTKYIEQEKRKTPGFEKAWENALENCENGKLGKYQSAAIYMYTVENPQVRIQMYAQFNKACREGKEAYKSGNFQFYTLYFFLTDAVQQLLKKQYKNRLICVTSYRKTSVTFKGVARNQIIRFGSFISSSLIKNLTNFGNESCFKIKTCFGAELKNYSAINYEKEVLIPPYETFKISGIQKNAKRNKLRCKVVYELKSTGKRSDLQCFKTKPPSVRVLDF